MIHKHTRRWRSSVVLTKKYDISTNLIYVIKGHQSTPLLWQHRRLVPKNSWSSTGCLLSSTFFHIFLERIKTDALEDHEDTVSIGGRAITNFRFADDIDGLAGEEEQLARSVERLSEASTAYGMEINAEKTKLMTNNTSGINTEIKINGQKLETLTSFKYLGSIITDEGSNFEILSRIAQTTAALTRLKPAWNDRSISLSFKIQLIRSLVTSIFL